MKATSLLLLSVLTISSGTLWGQNDLNPAHDTYKADVTHSPIDTLDTGQKYLKVILYDDRTWEYIETGLPKIDSAEFFRGWDTHVMHSFMWLTPRDLPEVIRLALVDDEHGFCPPIRNSPGTTYRLRPSFDHNGVEVSLATGDTVRAAFCGLVRYANTSFSTGSYGSLVIVRHPNGMETYYGHLSKILVDAEQMVRAGDVLGLGGSTGSNSEPSLRFETRYMGQPFDSGRVLDFRTGTLRTSVLTLERKDFTLRAQAESREVAEDTPRQTTAQKNTAQKNTAQKNTAQKNTAQKENSSGDRVIHVIRSGDTLTKIAEEYGTTITELCRLNGIGRDDIIQSDTKLIIK